MKGDKTSGDSGWMDSPNYHCAWLALGAFYRGRCIYITMWPCHRSSRRVRASPLFPLQGFFHPHSLLRNTSRAGTSIYARAVLWDLPRLYSVLTCFVRHTAVKCVVFTNLLTLKFWCELQDILSDSHGLLWPSCYLQSSCVWLITFPPDPFFKASLELACGSLDKISACGAPLVCAFCFKPMWAFSCKCLTVKETLVLIVLWQTVMWRTGTTFTRSIVMSFDAVFIHMLMCLSDSRCASICETLCENRSCLLHIRTASQKRIGAAMGTCGQERGSCRI